MNDVEQPSLPGVVITGIGIVAPNGIGKEAFWQSCTLWHLWHQTDYALRCQFPARTRIAGEVVNFDPMRLGLTEI